MSFSEFKLIVNSLTEDNLEELILKDINENAGANKEEELAFVKKILPLLNRSDKGLILSLLKDALKLAEDFEAYSPGIMGRSSLEDKEIKWLFKSLLWWGFSNPVKISKSLYLGWRLLETN